MGIRASLLVYDIPTAIHHPNPSKDLRRIGVRVNLSCWVVPNNYIPHHMLQRWDARGIRWHLIPFAETAAEQLLQLARSAILADLTSLEASLRRRNTLAYAVQSIEAQERFVARLQVAHCRAGQLLVDLQHAAGCFGLHDLRHAIDLSHIAVQQLTTAARARAAVYADAAYLATVNAETAHYAEAACQDQLPDYALADLLEDAGEDSRPLRVGLGQVE